MKRMKSVMAVAVFCAVCFALTAGAQQAKKAPAAKAPAAKAPAKPAAKPAANPLLDPKSPSMNKQAPPKFLAKFSTSKGDFTVEVTRDWAPQGADRFYNLVRNGFFDDARFFRVLTGFVAQFGVNGDPKISAVWKDANIPDDPAKESNKRGMLVFATAGPNTRTTQLFINLVDNARLDSMGFAPFGRVIEGMDIVDSLYAGYKDGPPRGPGPNQDRIQSEGNAYLAHDFPKLDFVKSAKIVTAAPAAKKAAPGAETAPGGAPARKPAAKK